MSIENLNQTNSQKLIMIASIIAIVGAIVAVGWLAKNSLGDPAPSASQKMELDKHPIPEWVSQYAVQCKGDITKLSAADQQKVQEKYPGQSARIVILVAYKSKK
ncbi:MAG: hypothetical protein H8F28_09720 [Fibrella sp.]|nr:hypothetical protein [Armatimonadota bacterium]